MKELGILLLAASVAACGIVGSPVPPETVGVAKTIEEQKRRDAAEAKRREAAESLTEAEHPGQDMNLPPLRPVGTR